MRALALLALAGCNSIFGFDAIHPLPDAANLGPTPNVFSLPGPKQGGLSWGAALGTVVLAADDPMDEIYYTTDGTDVLPTSTHATTPISSFSATTYLSVDYFAQGPMGATSVPQRDIYIVDTSSLTRDQLGYVVSKPLMDGTSPFVFATAGQKLSATVDVQIWVQSVLPAAATQLVWGINDGKKTTYFGCLYDGGPGVYPGASKKPASFTITAPSTPGIYEVRVVDIEDNTCAMALATPSTLDGRPDRVRIGVVVVR
jgi:hypothetical protein